MLHQARAKWWWWWWQCWCSGRVHRLMRLLPPSCRNPSPPAAYNLANGCLFSLYSLYSLLFYLCSLFSFYLHCWLSPKLSKRKSTASHQFLSFSLVDSRRRNIVHICSFWAKLAYFLNESNFSSVSCLSVSNRHGVEVLDLVSASIKCLLGRLSGDQTHRFLATADAFLSSPRK